MNLKSKKDKTASAEQPVVENVDPEETPVAETAQEQLDSIDLPEGEPETAETSTPIEDAAEVLTAEVKEEMEELDEDTFIAISTFPSFSCKIAHRTWVNFEDGVLRIDTTTKEGKKLRDAFLALREKDKNVNSCTSIVSHLRARVVATQFEEARLNKTKANIGGFTTMVSEAKQQHETQFNPLSTKKSPE